MDIKTADTRKMNNIRNGSLGFKKVPDKIKDSPSYKTF